MVKGAKLAISGLAMLFLFSGCRHYGPYDVEMKVGADMTGRSVQVDVVGINEADYDVWYAYSLSEYWKPGNSLRRDAERYKETFRFGISKSSVQELSIRNELWDRWEERGCRYLFVLADLGRNLQDLPGSADPRRLILPLNSKHWDGRQLSIVVEPSSIRLLTPMKKRSQ